MPRGRQRIEVQTIRKWYELKNDTTDKRRKKILERNDIERYEKKIKNWGNFVKKISDRKARLPTCRSLCSSFLLRVCNPYDEYQITDSEKQMIIRD